MHGMLGSLRQVSGTEYLTLVRRRDDMSFDSDISSRIDSVRHQRLPPINTFSSSIAGVVPVARVVSHATTVARGGADLAGALSGGNAACGCTTR
jgi:hypothetical protein